MLKPVELLVGQILHVDQLRTRRLDRTNELVELELKHLGVTILRVLNHEHHQKSDDGRASVDRELPGVRVAKEWAYRAPNDHGDQGKPERPWRADGDRDPMRESPEGTVGNRFLLHRHALRLDLVALSRTHRRDRSTARVRSEPRTHVHRRRLPGPLPRA